MPVKRRFGKAREGAISPDLIRRWRRARALNEQAHHSPAHRDLAYSSECDLNRSLGLRLWDYNVLDDVYFTSDQPPAYLERQAPERIPLWHRTNELRRQLAEAEREMRRQERPVEPS